MTSVVILLGKHVEQSVKPYYKPLASVSVCFAHLQNSRKGYCFFSIWFDRFLIYRFFVYKWLKDTLPTASYLQVIELLHGSTLWSHSKLTRCSCVTPHYNRAPPCSPVHDAAVLQSETIRSRSYPFWSWTWERPLKFESWVYFISY